MNFNLIIPNYNGFSLINKNLPEILKIISKYNNICITIVDDGSEKEEKSLLRNLVSGLQKQQKINITLLENIKNLGFSSAINKGILASNSDYVILMNSDVIPQEGFLDKVIDDFLKNYNLFGVGCMDKSIEKEKVILRGRGIGFWKKGFLMHTKGNIDKNNTFWLSGGSSIIKKELFVRLGGFDTLYNPFYWEDVDLSYRAQKAGYSLIFEKDSIVIHKHLEGAIRKYHKNFYVKTITYRNQFIFVWKNITDLNLILSHLIFLPYHFAKAALRLDLAFYYAFFLALAKFPDIIIKRQKQKKFYAKSDSEILKSFL